MSVNADGKPEHLFPHTCFQSSSKVAKSCFSGWPILRYPCPPGVVFRGLTSVRLVNVNRAFRSIFKNYTQAFAPSSHKILVC